LLNDSDKQTTWEIFEQHQDKAWSYTDCSLLAVARRLGIWASLPLVIIFSKWG